MENWYIYRSPKYKLISFGVQKPTETLQLKLKLFKLSGEKFTMKWTFCHLIWMLPAVMVTKSKENGRTKCVIIEILTIPP